jgi:hypothetical protein
MPTFGEFLQGDGDPIADLMTKFDTLLGDTVTEAQFRAAFLAARELGKVLDDDVLRAVILAARHATEVAGVESNEDREARHRALAIRRADQDAQERAEQALSATKTPRRPR